MTRASANTRPWETIKRGWYEGTVLHGSQCDIGYLIFDRRGSIIYMGEDWRVLSQPWWQYKSVDWHRAVDCPTHW